MRKIVLLALKKLRGGQQKISGNDLCKSIIILFKRTPKDSKTEMAGLDSDFAFLDLLHFASVSQPSGLKPL